MWEACPWPCGRCVLAMWEACPRLFALSWPFLSWHGRVPKPWSQEPASANSQAPSCAMEPGALLCVLEAAAGGSCMAHANLAS